MGSKCLFSLALIALSTLCTTSGYAKRHESSSSSSDSDYYSHNLQLQLYDVYGVPVDGTQFWISIKVLKDKNRVTLQFPAINFQTGLYANNPYEPNCNPYSQIFPPFAFPMLTTCPAPGGYLYTSDGFLPEDLRPTDLIDRSFSVPSNQGNNLSYSYDDIPDDLPVPLSGYILQVTNQGAIVIQAQGTFGNVIPAGNQNLLPTDVTYIVEPISKLKHNKVLSTGFTSTAQFTDFGAQVFGLRDSHLNDAYDGIAAWTWLDNSTETDKTNNLLNVMVAVGKIGKDGKIKARKPVQLFTSEQPLLAQYDTAVTINRTDKKNIIVSYGVTDYSNPFEPVNTYRAVSFDGGKTWPYNGPINLPTGPGGLGDNPGVSSDRYGNIWYVLSSALTPDENYVNQADFWVSIDKGITFSEVAVLGLPPANFHNGNLFYTFGGDGLGNYGLWFTTVQFNTFSPPFQAGSLVGFIPIYGFNNFGSLTSADLTSIVQDVNVSPSIAASLDGRMWLYGYPNVYVGGTFPAPASGISTVKMLFKSPGALDQNYAGPWDFATTCFLNRSLAMSTDDSQPIFGYYNFDRTMLYDDERQALYAMTISHAADFSQNMKLYLAISRDNGQTWSRAIEVANSGRGNRGIQTMALDTAKGDLFFGWYDGRHDPTFQSVQYYSAVIPAKKLDKMVKKIPLSNPFYATQQVTNCPTCQTGAE